MRKLYKLTMTALMAALLSAASITVVFADSAISTVSIKVGVNLTAGDRLDDITTNSESSDGSYVISNNTSRYDIQDAEWVSSTSKDMTIGESPKMEVTLNAGNDYYFKGTYRSSNVTIKGGSFYSAKRVDDDTLVITLKVDPIKGQYEAPNDAYWRDSGLGKAKWESVDGADAYDVYLYRGSSIIHKVEALKSTSYNFYPYMTKAGTYSFKVRAVPSSSTEQKYGKKSDWTESDEMYIAKEDVSDGSGQNNNNGGSDNNSSTDQVGWIKNNNTWYYRYPDGSYQKNGWSTISGKWYLFDGDGRMLTGWQQKNDKWFYLNPNGDMATGWLRTGDKWYYLYEAGGDLQGTMCTGWIQYNGRWYYGGSSGALIEGWNQVEGSWRYFYPGNGDMAVNTTIDGFPVDGNGIWNK